VDWGSLTKRNIYSVLKDISEEPEHVANINVQKTQGITAKNL
jgi:hypothetical protein